MTQVQPLIICEAGFTDESLVKLEAQSVELSGAVVVRTVDQLQLALGQSGYFLILHIFNNSIDAIDPADALAAVVEYGGDAPYVASGEGLTASQAVELINDGAADCLLSSDNRTISDVIHSVVEAYRHSHIRRKSNSAVIKEGQLFNALGEGLVVMSDVLRIEQLNPALRALTGYQGDDLKGAVIYALDAGGLTRHLSECHVTGEGWCGEVQIRRKDGSEFPAWAVISAMENDKNGTLNDNKADAESGRYAILISDMTERKSQELSYKYKASFDALTGLPNRELLQDRLLQLLGSAKRKKSRVAVMYIDLDFFKDVNDTWGHAIGDQLLLEAATRMQGCVRQSDTVARIGGDEFAVILSDVKDSHFAEQVAGKLLGSLEQSFVFNGAAVYISASIGIALYPLHGNQPETLFVNADAAMYEVKRNGRRGYRTFGDASEAPHKGVIGVPFSKGSSSVASNWLYGCIKQAQTLKGKLPPVPLFSAGMATACILIFAVWYVIKGTEVFQFIAPEELISATEMENFSTASGLSEDTQVLEIPKPEPK